jgi:hypothetical protein
MSQCQKCGKKLTDPHATHCSEECLFDDIKKSKPFVVDNENS